MGNKKVERLEMSVGLRDPGDPQGNKPCSVLDGMLSHAQQGKPWAKLASGHVNDGRAEHPVGQFGPGDPQLSSGWDGQALSDVAP